MSIFRRLVVRQLPAESALTYIFVFKPVFFFLRKYVAFRFAFFFGQNAFRRFPVKRFQGVIQIQQSQTVFGRKWYRFAQAKLVGLMDAVFLQFPFTFVGQQDNRFAALADQPGKKFVIGLNAVSRIEQNKQTSASLIARSVCCHILFSRQSSLAYSNPAVSIICKSMSRSLVSVSLRSRVTPGLSCTMAILRPASRLNNVDFPTFGRPTMAAFSVMSNPICKRSNRRHQ